MCITITKGPSTLEFTRPILAIQPGPNIFDKLCTSLRSFTDKPTHHGQSAQRPQRPVSVCLAFPDPEQQQTSRACITREPRSTTSGGPTRSWRQGKGPFFLPRRSPRSCQGASAPSTPADSVSYGLLLLRARFASPSSSIKNSKIPV